MSEAPLIAFEGNMGERKGQFWNNQIKSGDDIHII